jgi:transposase
VGGPGTRYSDEFKAEAVGQVIDRGYSVREVARRIGVSEFSLHQWVKRERQNGEQSAGATDLAAENARLKRELKRVEEELRQTERARSTRKPRRTSRRSPIEVRLRERSSD